MRHVKTLSKTGVPATASILGWFGPGGQKKGAADVNLAAYIAALFARPVGTPGTVNPEDI